MFQQGRVPLRFFMPCGTDLQFSYFFIKIVNEWHDFCSIYSEHIKSHYYGSSCN